MADATTITEQIVREAPEIEAYKVGLLQSAKGLANLPVNLPAYNVAGFNPDQLAAFQQAREGIGAYQPYLYGGAEALQRGVGTTGEAADVLRGADTRNQYFAAQQAMNLGAQAAGQAGQAAGMIPGAFDYVSQGAGLTGLAALQGAQASQLGAAPLAQAARTGYSPNIQAYQMSPAERVAAQQVGTPLMSAAQTGYAPELERFQMGPAQQVSTQSITDQGTAAAYMSPFIQQALEPALREMQRQADIQATRESAQAVGAGAFGGSRQAIQRAEAARNLQRSQADVIAQGLQQAYGQAQQQFNAEQQARLAAQQANQAAGLTVGQQNLAANLGIQQLGTQTGLQTALANLSSSQQANVQNQAAQLQAQGMNAQQALQAALANQAAGLTVGQQNLASQQQAQQLGTQTGLQTALANLTNEQQAALANQAMLGQYGLTQGQLGMQAAGLTGQLGGQMGQLGSQIGNLAGQQANIYGQQAGLYGNLGQGIGQLAGQQFGVGQQIAQGLGQFGAQLGNLGVQQAALGQTAQQLGQGDVNFLYNIGQQQQALTQQQLDAQRNTALQQAYEPYQRISFLSDIYKGAPSSQQSISAATAPVPSAFQQAVGTGIAALSAGAAAKKAGLF